MAKKKKVTLPERFPAMRLNVLFRTQPEQAKSEVTAAILAASGHLEKAAEALGIGARTLDRILQAHPEIDEAAKAARAEARAKERAEREAEEQYAAAEREKAGAA